jgi:hypothetical protein
VRMGTGARGATREAQHQEQQELPGVGHAPAHAASDEPASKAREPAKCVVRGVWQVRTIRSPLRTVLGSRNSTLGRAPNGAAGATPNNLHGLKVGSVHRGTPADDPPAGGVTDDCDLARAGALNPLGLRVLLVSAV